MAVGSQTQYPVQTVLLIEALMPHHITRRLMIQSLNLGLLAAACLGMTTMQPTSADEKKTPDALDFTMKSLDGKDVKLNKYEGKVILAVNVASRCGATPQYADLQKLHEEFADKGLVVLGFPCNQFGKQEPGSSSDIKEFCTKNYGVSFDMFEKIEVNGDEACDLYKHLTAIDAKPAGKGDIRWNFEKFLIGRDGQVAGRFSTRTSPSDEEFVGMIKKLLEAK